MIVYQDYRYLPLAEPDRDYYISVYRNTQVMSHVMEMPDAETCTRYFDTMLQAQKKATPDKLVFTIHKNHERIGLIGIYWNQATQEAVELGTLITTEYQSRGYGSDATLGLALHALSAFKLKEVVLISEVDNHQATKSALKMGFKKAAETEVNRVGRLCHRWVLKAT